MNALPKVPKCSGGSEIWTSLDFKWLKRGWFANGPDFKWDLKSDQKCPDFERSSFQMAGTIAVTTAQPFENRTICSLIFKKSGF